MDNASLRGRGGDAELKRRRCPPALKITQCVLIGLENSLLYMILQGLSRTPF